MFFVRLLARYIEVFEIKTSRCDVSSDGSKPLKLFQKVAPHCYMNIKKT